MRHRIHGDATRTQLEAQAEGHGLEDHGLLIGARSKQHPIIDRTDVLTVFSNDSVQRGSLSRHRQGGWSKPNDTYVNSATQEVGPQVIRLRVPTTDSANILGQD